MATIDYTKLCPKSGRPLTADERDALGAREIATGRTREVQCAACGRLVSVRPHPGAPLYFVYPMHVKSDATQQ